MRLVKQARFIATENGAVIDDGEPHLATSLRVETSAGANSQPAGESDDALTLYLREVPRIGLFAPELAMLPWREDAWRR